MANIKNYLQLFDEKAVLEIRVEKLEGINKVLKNLIDQIGHFQPQITAECLKEVERIETSN